MTDTRSENGGIDDTEQARTVLGAIATHLGRNGVLSVLQTAADEVRAGSSGIIFENDGSTDGSTPYVLSVGEDAVDFRHGALGPYVLPLSELIDAISAA